MFDQKNTKKIYEAIADGPSKEIFCSRLLYSMTGDISLLTPMADSFQRTAEANEKWASLKAYLSGLEEKPYMFGMGSYGTVLCRRTGGADRWSGFLDNSPKSDTHMGLPVIKVKEFLKNYSGEKIVLPSKAFFVEMKKQLVEEGIAEENIIDGTAWYDATEGRQYFDLPNLIYDEDEVFIDGGSCDGMSSIGFAEQCGGKYRKIYCFEPDQRNMEKLKRNLASRGIEKYELIDKGLWNTRTELAFVANGTANSHIAAGGEDREMVSVISLDEVLAGEKASFIKMDIEGAEYEALQGAQKTIAEYKPRLAICVYHNPEDIWKLPELILDLRPDYKLYFRHYSVGSTETVVYAL